jgi:hypothetical protein
MRALTEATANAASGASDHSARAVHDLVVALSSATVACREARVEADARAAALEERVQYDESELRRATADVARLRAALKDEKKRNEKLFATLDLEREASAQAQTVIGDLRGRLLDGSSGGGGGGASIAPGRGSIASFSAADSGLHRHASLAGRASFAAMAAARPVSVDRASPEAGHY